MHPGKGKLGSLCSSSPPLLSFLNTQQLSSWIGMHPGEGQHRSRCSHSAPLLALPWEEGKGPQSYHRYTAPPLLLTPSAGASRGRIPPTMWVCSLLGEASYHRYTAPPLLPTPSAGASRGRIPPTMWECSLLGEATGNGVVLSFCLSCLRLPPAYCE